jgi:methanol---5-hydroxybenzimidazolylcobamide Co-methyltransferase
MEETDGKSMVPAGRESAAGTVLERALSGRRTFTSLALGEQDLVFGRALHPVVRNGVEIGGGDVLPEIKFTLPPMQVTAETLPEVRLQYREMLDGICRRAVDLGQEKLVVEFELLPPMTVNPGWGADITAVIREVIDSHAAGHGLKALLRITAVDLRERHGAGKRSGTDLDNVLDTFRLCAKAGGDLLAIESIGGKEVTDKAVMEADLPAYVMGMLLACRDMEFIWDRICGIARETGTVASGDTACGFGNTAMVLADRRYTPKTFAAVVRAMTAVRSLVAYEQGAVGPGKDCGYENPYLKAITGFPMSMEGKSAACAHLSSLGNIAAAYADLWSNESVQNIKLLSGMAPVVSLEQLAYDCRLFNASSRSGHPLVMRNWLVQADAGKDVQAYIFTPANVVKIARAVIGTADPFTRIVNAGKVTVDILRAGAGAGEVVIPEREGSWLDMMENALNALPAGGEALIASLTPAWAETVDFEQYGKGDE